MFRHLAILTFAASTLAAQSARGTDPDFVRLPGVPLHIKDSVSIDVKTAKLDPPYNMFALPRGRVIVAGQFMSAIAGFDSMGRRLWSKENRRQSEVGDVSSVGWLNDQVWISDRAFQQVALLDQYGNVDKSLELPDFVRPTFSQRKSFPMFGALTVLALYPDNSMLVIPRRPKEITTSAGYDDKSIYLLRVSEDGIIQRQIAKAPSGQLTVPWRGSQRPFDDPLNRQLIRVSGDGHLIVAVAVDTTSPKADSIIIRGINDRGDTIYTQRLAYPAVHYTDAQMDSVLRSRFGSAVELREQMVKVVSHRAPPFSDFVIDVDHSVWMTLRGTATSHSVIGFDGTGKPIGKLQLDAKRAVRAADRGRLWVSEARNIDRAPLVRYTLIR